jgi:hypothetical protein
MLSKLMTPTEKLQRGVNTLQGLYAVIIALAVSEGLKRTFLAASGDTVNPSRLALLLALIATVVPFIHGMNRHMDELIAKPTNPKRLTFLVLDFCAFLIASCLIFLIAVSVSHPKTFIRVLVLLLAFDVVWALATWFITRGVALRWAAINIVAMILLLLAENFFPSEPELLIITPLLAVSRTAADYIFCSQFYFPREEPNA